MRLPLHPSSDHLLAVVEVMPSEAVQCQEAGCGRRIHREIHVVQRKDETQLLGMTCFGKRYAGWLSSSGAGYSASSCRRLTSEERALLQANAATLIARFEDEARAAAAAAAEKERRYRVEREQRMAAAGSCRKAPERPRATLSTSSSGYVIPNQSVWPWAKAGASFAYFRLHDGSGWMRVPHQDGRQFLAPYPIFDGWDEALPAEVGVADPGLGALAVANIAASLVFLRRMAVAEKIGDWRTVSAFARLVQQTFRNVRVTGGFQSEASPSQVVAPDYGDDR